MKWVFASIETHIIPVHTNDEWILTMFMKIQIPRGDTYQILDRDAHIFLGLKFRQILFFCVGKFLSYFFFGLAKFLLLFGV